MIIITNKTHNIYYYLFIARIYIINSKHLLILHYFAFFFFLTNVDPPLAG